MSVRVGDSAGITYADVIVAAFFTWVQKTLGKDSQEWKDIATWDDGRWGKLVAGFEKYGIFDAGEDFQPGS